jgi:hypothetical protein
MSVDASRTTAFTALVMDRQRCCSAQYVANIAFQMARSDETQRQRRWFKLDHPIHGSPSLDPGALTAPNTRPTAIKSP